MTEEENRQVDELLFWLNWTARQVTEASTELIYLQNSPLMEEVYINLN